MSTTRKPLNGEEAHSPKRLAAAMERVGAAVRSRCGAVVPGPLSDLYADEGGVACLRRKGHAPPCIPILCDALAADDNAPAQKPRRQRCPGSGMTVHLQGLQIAARKAPCPECQALRPIAPEPDRTAVLPTHMREVKQ